jgi:plasmid stability protein
MVRNLPESKKEALQVRRDPAKIHTCMYDVKQRDVGT